MNTTGERCDKSGIYYCEKHPQNEIPVAVGEKFPPCSRDGGHATKWVLRKTGKSSSGGSRSTDPFPDPSG